MFKPVAGLLLSTLALSLLVAGPASATTYTITSTLDESPDLADNGICTLREAIHMASTNSTIGDIACGAAGQPSPDTDTIEISATAIQLDPPVGTDDNFDGDLDLVRSAAAT